MAKEFRFNEHNVVLFEAPDLVIQQSDGPADVDSIDFLFKTLSAIAAEHGKPRALSLSGPKSAITMAARKRIGELDWPVKCWAAVAPNFAFRALLNMITRAQQLIGNIKYEAKMFATEEEARSWMETFK